MPANGVCDKPCAGTTSGSAEPTRAFVHLNRDAGAIPTGGKPHTRVLFLDHSVRKVSGYVSPKFTVKTGTWWPGPAAPTGMSRGVKVLIQEPHWGPGAVIKKPSDFQRGLLPFLRDYGAPTPPGATRSWGWKQGPEPPRPGLPCSPTR